jgi:hypothetical protein
MRTRLEYATFGMMNAPRVRTQLSAPGALPSEVPFSLEGK